MKTFRSFSLRTKYEDIEAPEPYKVLSGGSFENKDVNQSPDPLVSYRFRNVDAADDLQFFCAYPVNYKTDSVYSFDNLGSSLSDSTCIEIKGDGDIMFDFGAEFAAWFEIESPDFIDLGSVMMSISEYTSPEIVNKGVQSPAKTGRPVKVSETTYRLVLNSELYEGVRFGFIHVRGLKQAFRITAVRLVCQVKPVNYNGSFRCDNEMLNRIWYAAAYDVRVNLKKDYISAILVDRGDRHSWTGDAYTAQAASLAAFANYDFVLENLKYTSTRPNGIESFELYWLLSLADYYDFTGDAKGTEALSDEAVKRLEHANEVFDKNPPLSFFGWDERLGAGFENPDIPGNRLSYKLLSIECLNKYANIFKSIGRDFDAERCGKYAADKTKELLSDPYWYESCGLHAFADAVNAGIPDKELCGRLFKKYFRDRLNRISFSPFNEYFILKALAKMGKFDEAISSISDLWGSQTEYGGTCFFEVFRPGWKKEIEKNGPLPNNQAGYTSLAHPWSAGVLALMSTEIAGIKPVLPGFSKLSVIPHLSTQLTSVSCEMPTPHGTVKASFDVKKGIHSVTVPKGTRALVAVPKAGRQVFSLKLNGCPARFDREDGEYYYFDDLGEGEYSFTASYSGKVKRYRAPGCVYPASFVGIVRGGRFSYGSEGRYDCSGGQTSKLPDYVNEVVLSRGVYIGEGANASYGTNYDNVCSQSFTADIKLKRKRRYTVALYFTANDAQNSLAVEMFDEKTLDLIAPVKVLKNYREGACFVYEYDASARFRIDHVRGDYVSLSGIYFGKD